MRRWVHQHSESILLTRTAHCSWQNGGMAYLAPFLADRAHVAYPSRMGRSPRALELSLGVAILAALSCGGSARIDGGASGGGASTSSTGAGAAECGPTPCGNGLSCCDGACIDTRSDPTHCGACGNTCLPDETCCDGACANTDLDAAHCGMCNHACGPGGVCVSGTCGFDCVGGATACGNVCVDTSTDPQHCGGCYNACAPGELCSDGVCQGPPCADAIHNQDETDVDCGGAVCPPCADGKACLADADCASGHCPSDDLVCCDMACNGPCVGCAFSKTGAPDGACTPLPFADPEGDCSFNCGTCDGMGGCVAPTCGCACPCILDAECVSGHCADNICCNSACNGTCEACMTSGSEGTCTPHPQGTDPDSECPPGQLCNGMGMCAP